MLSERLKIGPKMNGRLEIMMKRKILMWMLLGCMAFVGCNSGEKAEEADTETDAAAEDTDEDTTPITKDTIEDKGIEAFVTIGEYMGIDLERPVYTVTEADIDHQIEIELTSKPMELTDPEATVAMGDTVNLDYSGSVDGVIFDGGTAEGYDLVIGSGSFIDDFEEQLVGMKVGESGEVEVTFPENYRAEEMRGAEAVFAVTINSINRVSETLTEEWLLANTSCTTQEEYREVVRENLSAQNEAQEEQEMMDAAWAQVFQTAEFIQYPQDLLDECYAQQEQSLESTAAMYGMDVDAYMEAASITEDDIMDAAKNALRNMLVFNYICEKEAMTADSQVYQDKQAEILTANGLTSLEDAALYGITEWNVDFVVKYNMVLDFIIDNAVVTEVAAE